MKARGYNQAMLAGLCGMKRQSNVSELLRGKSMVVSNFLKVLNAMGFDVIIKDRNSSNKENVWKLTQNADGQTDVTDGDLE